MENIWVLFLVIAVFNVISTMIKKAKESQQAPPVRVVRVSPPGLGDTPPPVRMRISEERPKPPKEPEWTGEGKTLEWHEFDAVEVAEAVQHGGEDEAANTAVTANLTKMLSSKDDLVAAFIFHEIMERPRSMQRRS